jgi:O-antigen ligase
LADVAAVATSATLIYFKPELNAWPLLLALTPWFVRLSAGAFPFRRTVLDIPLVIFMLTALVGVWAAYNRQAAWAKFWVLATSVLLFYALAGQPAQNLWPVAAIFAGLAVFASAYFLLTHNWVAEPLKVGFLNQIGTAWTPLRPKLNAEALHANSAASWMAMFLPFIAALTVRTWRNWRPIGFILSLAAIALVAFGLLMTTSRGAWLALSIVLGLWLLWGLSGMAGRVLRLSRWPVLGFLLLAMAGFALVLFVAFPTDLEVLAASATGTATAETRLELMRSAVNLAGDFPFTGGGLGSFPGLYSQYVRVIPFFLIAHAHNTVLDITVEQGMVGAAAFIFVILVSLILPLRAVVRGLASPTLLTAAALSSLLVAVFHGLFDDVLYGLKGTPLLFAVPGFVIALASVARQGGDVREQVRAHGSGSTKARRLATGSAGLVLIGLLPVVYGLRETWLGAWYANLGAVHMGRSELAEWPTGEWDDGSRVRTLVPAEALFNKALEHDPANRTAHHRLGLISMLRQDFEAAVADLEPALAADPAHRGIRKSLGYSYAWNGELDRAYPLLVALPEVTDEMAVYLWWWGTQGRPDLAGHAIAMEDLLE